MSAIKDSNSDSLVADAAKDHLKLLTSSDPDQVAGIVRFELLVSQEIETGGEVRVFTQSVDSGIVIPNLIPGQSVTVGLHTHLLKNGPHKIAFELTEANGATCAVNVSISVENTSDLAQETATLLRENDTPVFFAGPCDSAMYPYGKHVAWFDGPDAEQHILHLAAAGVINEVEAEQLRVFVRDGFLILPDLIDEELVAAVNAEIDHAIDVGVQGYKFGTSQRIEHLHAQYPYVRKLWLDERHRRFANLIFGSTARPCQTLTYVFGSQQDAHQDTIHLTPFPAGYMCGTWIALQDVVPDSGELVVYKGSHRERRVYMAEAGLEKITDDWSVFGETVCRKWEEMSSRYEPIVYRPKKGTVLIWHENLLHAGSVRVDKSLQRRSIVIHCFADGALAYYDSTGMGGSAVPVRDLPAAQ